MKKLLSETKLACFSCECVDTGSKVACHLTRRQGHVIPDLIGQLLWISSHKRQKVLEGTAVVLKGQSGVPRNLVTTGRGLRVDDAGN